MVYRGNGGLDDYPSHIKTASRIQPYPVITIISTVLTAIILQPNIQIK
jgi:hypothetical protein